MKIKFYLLLSTLVLLSGIPCSFGQGTAFTYQGQLLENGARASGVYNLAFSLFSADRGGSPVVGPVAGNGVIVNDGLFTVLIDFGPGIFTGANNWMEIGVQTNGAASFTTLTPRQQLTPAPYSLFAAAANVTSAVSAASPVANSIAAVKNGNDLAGNDGGLANLNGVALAGVVSNLKTPVLNPANPAPAPGLRKDEYSPAFTIAGLTSSNTLYAIAVQWTNIGGAQVLMLSNPSNQGNPTVLPVADGIPTNSSGAPIAGYYSIYDSSGLTTGPVTTWADLGPYGHNLTATPGNAPTTLGNYVSGRSAVAFSNAAFANTYYLTNLNYASPAGPSEVFLMLSDNNKAQAAPSWTWQTLLAPAPGTSYGAQYLWINNGYYDLRAQLGGGYPASSPAPFPTGNWIVVDCVFNPSGSSVIYTNNVFYYQGTFARGTASLTNIQLGGQSFNGLVTFLGVYTNMLSPSDRANVYGYLTNRYPANPGPVDYGAHSVFWTHDGWFNAGANQTDLQYSNVASLSYGSALNPNGAFIALFPATNQAVLSDPVFDFTCNYTGTNLMCYSGANSVLNFDAHTIDGDSNYPYTAETNIGTGWIHFNFSKNIQHTIRFRTNGKQFHGTIFRVMTGDSIAPTAESAHRVKILFFGDSHTDGNTSAGEMDTLVNRIHSFLNLNCDVFGSGLGGSGILALGSSGFTYLSRFYNDIFLQQPKPDILVWEGSNDHSLIVDNTSSNNFWQGAGKMALTISSSMPASNVWVIYGPQPCGTGQIDIGGIFCRNTLQSNATYFGFNFIDFLGGATNTTDINHGYVTDSNYATMWNGGHLSTPAGKEWFAQFMATNMNAKIAAIKATK